MNEVYRVFNKEYTVDFAGVADGSGLWGMPKGHIINFTTLRVEITMSQEEGEEPT